MYKRDLSINAPSKQNTETYSVCLARKTKIKSTPQQHQVHDVTMAGVIFSVTNSVLFIVSGDELFILNPHRVPAVSQQTQLIAEHVHAATRKLFAARPYIALQKTLQR